MLVPHKIHKSLSWLTTTDKERIISQLRTKMLNVAPALVSDVLIDTVAEPLHQRKAKSSVFDEAKL